MNKTMHALALSAILAIGFIIRVPYTGAQVDNAQAPDVIFVNGKIATVNQDLDIVGACNHCFVSWAALHPMSMW